MAPPTRLRPHLDDLLQKNLELEHTVADLRHQLTQNSAKWADERKTLAGGCDTLMASFAKFRARLDVQASDFGDSEGEVEQNLDTGRQSEEAGEVDSGMIEIERDWGPVPAAEGLHERCRTLAAELLVKEEELEESGRKREAAEEELRRIRRLLDTQSEQLRAALVASRADTGNEVSPELTPDNTATQANPSETPPKNLQEKLDQANQEIIRLKQLLQEWKKYGSDWKRDGQLARVRACELHRREDELNAKIKAVEETKARQDVEIQSMASALADQTVAVEQHHTACLASEIRVRNLEAMVTRLRAQLSPEQLASFDSKNKPPAPGSSAHLQTAENETTRGSSHPSPRGADGVSPTAPTDTSANKRSEMIMLKIPCRGKSIRNPSTENTRSPGEQQNATATPSQQAPANQSIRISPAPQKSNNSPNFNCTDFEVCIHTCNASPCRNDSRSFLWPRKQPSLPRHVLSTKRHQLCSPLCPGYRLLNMPLGDATKESRKAKCRPPTEVELSLAIQEDSEMPPGRRTGEKWIRVAVEGGGSGEPEEQNEERPTQGEVAREGEEEQSSQMDAHSVVLGKRQRTRTTDGEERARKLRPRMSLTAKS